jgi:hypothetical protein
MELKLGVFTKVTLVVAVLLVTNLFHGLNETESAEASPVTLTDAPLSVVESEETTGSGFWWRLGCVGCGTGILLAGGSSVVGLIAIGGAFPHVLAGCATVCVAAFGADKLW